MVNFTPRQLYFRERAPVTTEQDRWALGRVWAVLEKKKSFDPAGIRNQDRTVRSIDNDIENDY